MATNDGSLRQQRETLNLTLDPIDAYRALRARGALLLTGSGQHPEHRYSIIAFSPHHDLRIEGRKRTITHSSGAREETQGEPLELLRESLHAWKFESVEPGFTGGYVGVIGYGFTTAIEPTLPRHPSNVPDVCLRLCRDALVFDHLAQEWTLWVTDLPGENEATHRLRDIVEELGQPLNPMQPVPQATVDWTPSMTRETFEAAVVRIKDLIRNGDLFQANIATRFTANLQLDPAALLAALRQHNPSPYLALMDWGDHCLVSGSPEQLFAIDDGRIRARPIAGTRRRGETPDDDARMEQELLSDRKEQAEHTMLVDLVRNDIARVSKPGTVQVPERGSVERYRRVMHLVSRVEGTLREDADIVDCMAALFPGGTITGAPKHRACMRIHEAEPVPRDYYTGSAGFVNWNHSTSHWNILIRSMLLHDGTLSVHAGSGIVMESEPSNEWVEAGNKARALLESAAGHAAPSTGDEGTVTPHGQWQPPTATGQVEARVLLVDHYDSFVHNLADYCAALGAAIHVVRCDSDLDQAIEDFAPTHLIFGPGPGWPNDAGNTPQTLAAMRRKLPMLGICLGHQAMAEATGANIVVAPRAVHGEVDTINQTGGLLNGLPATFEATRYHSLIVDEGTLDPDWVITARLMDGTIMAMEHPDGMVGLQFHPESIGTPVGLDILFRFLNSQ